MSAPETNIERQKKRHKPSILGIAAAVGLAMIIAVVVLSWPTRSDGMTTEASPITDEAYSELGE